MSAKWKVWNMHPNGLTHKEKFKENLIEIPAGQYVEMDYEDAVQFRGQFFPMRKDAMGQPDPKSFKVIKIEKPTDEAPIAAKEFICHIDGAKFPSQALLDAYIKTNHDGKAFKDDRLDEQIEKEVARKGPGRPPKEKTA
jgi:hypothetical protein